MFQNDTGRPISERAQQEIKAYSNRLCLATNYWVRLTLDDEDCPQFWLMDPCGDPDGDAWDSFSDLMHETEDTVKSYEQAIEREMQQGSLTAVDLF